MDCSSKASIGSRLAGPFREFGLGAGLLYAIDRVLGRVSPHLRLHVYEFMAQPIAVGDLPGARLLRNLEVRPIRPGDPEIAAMPVRPEVMKSRIRQGCECLGVFQRGTFAGYMWFSAGRYEEDEVACTYVLAPPDQAVFDFDFYLFPEHRMGAAFVGLWNGANRVLRERGVTYTFSRVTRFNAASRRAHARLGARRIGTGAFLMAGRLQLMLATVHPYVHLRVGASTPVRLRLSASALPGKATDTASRG